jgi:hypothetical protein
MSMTPLVWTGIVFWKLFRNGELRMISVQKASVWERLPAFLSFGQ